MIKDWPNSELCQVRSSAPFINSQDITGKPILVHGTGWYWYLGPERYSPTFTKRIDAIDWLIAQEQACSPS